MFSKIVLLFCHTILLVWSSLELLIYRLLNEHKDAYARRQRELEATQCSLYKIKNVTGEVKLQQLVKDVEKCMTLKSLVLSDSEDSETALPKLTEEQEAQVRNALNPRKNHDDVLVSKFSLNITRRDMMTLDGLNWLNDEVINFYMNLIIERGRLPKFPKVYAFNTFFYPKLLQGGQDSLKRWTRRAKVDIFELDLLCVPIHLGVHWCMAICDFRTKEINYFDSMGQSNSKCTSALAKYLEDEHLEKKKIPYSTRDWTLRSLKDIPQQMNGSDCGMFACTFAEYATRNAKFTFTQQEMPYFRRKMVVEILSGQLLIT